MRNGFKYLNILLLAGFVCYWFLAVLLTFLPKNIFFAERDNIYLQTFFPPVYKMFTSPPKERVVSDYIFYRQNVEVAKINADSLFHLQMKKHFPTPTFKKEMKQHQAIFTHPSREFTVMLYRYYLDSLHIAGEDIPQHLNNHRPMAMLLQNQLMFAGPIKEMVPTLNDSDSVVLKVTKKQVPLAMDPFWENKPAALVPDMVLYHQGIKMKHAQ